MDMALSLAIQRHMQLQRCPNPSLELGVLVLAQAQRESLRETVR